MVVLNKIDMREVANNAAACSSSGNRGTPRGSGSHRIRNGSLTSRDNSTSAAVADVIACATGYSMDCLMGRKLSNNQLLLNPAAIRQADQQFHHRMNHSNSNSGSSGSGGSGSRFQPLSLMHTNDVQECMEDEDECMSAQTPLYEAIDPSRLTRYASHVLFPNAVFVNLILTTTCTLSCLSLLPLSSCVPCYGSGSRLPTHALMFSVSFST